MKGRLGSDAGQVEDLVDRLRGLIRDYPLGVGLIKEFLQNADDAGASWVRFTLDERTLNAERLPDPRMATLMGPALLVTSDQVFSKDDLVAIQRLQEGHKRSDASTTGRFGLGFNSVYNVTDYPSFVTGSVVMTFDPHRDAVALESGRPGWEWPLNELWRVAPDWPAAFGLRHGVGAVEETTFRLPLRTRSQCGAGRLARSAVSPKAISKLLREVADGWGGSLLLFLRHVLHVELCFVDKAGHTRWQASVRTENEDEVRRARDQHASPLARRTVDDIWSAWEKLPTGLPEVLYEHRFRVSRDGKEGALEAWLVAQGAGLRSQERLFDTARTLLKIEEKPLPLVGAACRLPNAPGGSLPELDGRLYCTLPLPDPIGTPFHINAFVDLDSSRRGPTASDDLAGNALLRKQWNEALLQDLVPEVAARLLAEVARRTAAGELPAGAPYQLCPRTRRGRVRWAEKVVKSLLRRFASVPFVLHQSGDRLTLRAVDVSRLAPSAWGADLRKAVVFDGFDIAQPPPPPDLIRSFCDVGVEFKEVDPGGFCDWLQEVDGDLWPELKQAPLRCLRTEVRLRAVIRFCSQRDGGTLDELPLGLRQDGALVRFGAKGLVTFFGWPEFGDLFPTRLHWFWSTLVEEEVKPSQVASPSMDAELAVLNLKTYLPTEAVEWDRSRESPPNEDWLTRLLQYLAGQELSEGAVQRLRRLALLPSSGGRLCVAESDVKAYFGVPKALRSGVEKLGWINIAATGALLQAVEQMAKRHPRVVPQCDAEAVCNLLVSSTHERLAGVTDGELKSLVRYVAEQWDEDEGWDIERLRSVPLWVTLEGERVAADTPNTFLAVGFVPPPGLVTFRVVQQAETQAVRSLQRRLGLDELTRESFARALGKTLSSKGEEGETARTWIVQQNWRTWSHHTKQSLRKNLRIPDDTGCMRAPADLFDPRERAILELFGGHMHVPSEQYRSDDWLYFLGHLGMRHRLEAGDLLRLVDAWAAEGAGADSYDSLLAWLSAAFERADGDRKELTYLEELVEPLQDKRWISTLVRAAMSDAVTRASRLRPPLGCVEHSWLDLVGEAAPVLPIQVRAKLRDALGVLARPTPEQVLQQFAVATVRAGEAKQLERYASLLLRWVQPDEVEVPERLLREAWLPSGDRRYPPDRVFFEDVQFSDGFFAQPAPSLAKLRESALKKVGVRARPDVDALVGLLRDVSAAVDREPSVLNIAGHVYQRLEQLQREQDDEWPDSAVTRTWLAPTRDGRFLPLAEVVLDDAPWLSATLEAAPVPWLRESVSPGFADALGARRASDAIRQRMVGGVALSEAREELRRLRALVEDPAFRSALQRLLRALLSGRAREEILQARDEAAGIAIQIRAYESLAVRWTLDGVALAESAEQVFVTRTSDIIAISVAGEEKRWHVMVARGLAEGLGQKGLFNNAVLEDLLRASPGDDLNELLDGRRIPSDPDAVEAVVAPLPAPEAEDGDDEKLPHDATEPEGASDSDSVHGGRAPGTSAGDGERQPTSPARGEVHVREHTRSHPAQGNSRGRVERAGRREEDASGVSREPEGTGGGDEKEAEMANPGYHWVEGHLRRNPWFVGSSPAGWEQHQPLGGRAQKEAREPGPSDAGGTPKASRPHKRPGSTKPGSMRGAVRVVPDGAFKPNKRFARVVRELGKQSGAKHVEFPKGKTLPEMWLTHNGGLRVAVFVCVLDGSWDDHLPDLRASAVEMLHKWGRKAELWVVERVNGADLPHRLKEPLQEAYTVKFGRTTRRKVGTS